ncbi:MAG: efflux RND transporter periplasmic adaptor subunit [Thermodesulfovibrionales bacterium]
MRKAVWIAIAAAVVLLVGRQVYLKTIAVDGSAGKRGGGAVAVEVAPVETATVRDSKVFTGTLVSSARFTVAPRVSGRLEKLLVNVGDTVRNGDLVAVLEDEEFIQQAGQAEAELRVARANLEESRSALEIAEREFERVRALREKKIVSQSDLDSAEAGYNAQVARHKVSQAQVAEKEAAFEAAKVRLSYTKIRASWEKNGGPRVVGERFAEQGDMLAQGSPIISVLDIASLTSVIHVTEGDYYKFRKGLPVVVYNDALPGRRFAGAVERIAPLLKETSREARVEIAVPNEGGLLKPGMFVRVEAEFAVREGSTVVPVRALASRGGRQGVFLADLEKKKAGFVPLTVGVISGDVAEVLEPRIEGWVVTLGQHLLDDGSSITVPGHGKGPETSGQGAGGGKGPGG